MKVSSVKKKLKQKAFAPGVNREEVYAAEQMLGLPLDEFIAAAIQGVQQVAPRNGQELWIAVFDDHAATS
jgi:predicted hydrolase (HD superfamily)